MRKENQGAVIKLGREMNEGNWQRSGRQRRMKNSKPNSREKDAENEGATEVPRLTESS